MFTIGTLCQHNVFIERLSLKLCFLSPNFDALKIFKSDLKEINATILARKTSLQMLYVLIILDLSFYGSTCMYASPSISLSANKSTR